MPSTFDYGMRERAAYRTTLATYLFTTNMEVDATVTQLTRQISAPHSWHSIEGGLWTLWNALLELVSETPSSSPLQARLVDLIEALNSQGALTDPIYKTNMGQVWLDLPQFGMAVREAWNSSPQSPDMSQEQWISLNTFLARLTAAGVVDWSSYAVWALRDALEESCGIVNGLSTEQEALLEDLLPAAVVWFEYSGVFMYDLVLEEKSYGPAGRQGPLCEEAGVHAEGFSIAGWNFWRQRLQEMGVLDGEVGATAGRAWRLMRKSRRRGECAPVNHEIQFPHPWATAPASGSPQH